MVTYAKQRFIWIGLAAALLAASLFGLAMMGSVAGAKPKELPVGLVVLDRGTALPDGGTLAVGSDIKERLLAMSGLPVEWEVFGSEEDARRALDEQRVYGALVLPADLSAGLLSLASPQPEPAVVQLLVNEGMPAQGAQAAKTGLGQAVRGIGSELSRQALAMIGSRTGQQIPVKTAEALLNPIVLKETSVHAAGANNAGGNAPVMLTQIMWMGCLIAGASLYLAAIKAKAAGGKPAGIVSLQTLFGLIAAGILSGFTVWMATAWYGMAIADAAAVWLFLWLAGAAFFFLQSALLNAIGFPAMALLVLLLFFSVPVVTMAPEFLPPATETWLYQWTPFRFAAEGLRSTMYFGGAGDAEASRTVLWWIAGCGFVVLAAAGLFKPMPEGTNVRRAL